jgi:hypothetical protein
MEPQFHATVYAVLCCTQTIRVLVAPLVNAANECHAQARNPEIKKVRSSSKNTGGTCTDAVIDSPSRDPPQARLGGGQTRCRRRTLVDLSGISIITGLVDLSLEQCRRTKSSDTLISRSSFCSFPHPFPILFPSFLPA